MDTTIYNVLGSLLRDLAESLVIADYRATFALREQLDRARERQPCKVLTTTSVDIGRGVMLLGMSNLDNAPAYATLAREIGLREARVSMKPHLDRIAEVWRALGRESEAAAILRSCDDVRPARE